MSLGTRWLGQCTSKRHYATRAEAEAEAAKLARRTGEATDAYRCRYCGAGFLVGRSQPNRQHLARARPKPGRGRVGWGELKRRGL